MNVIRLSELQTGGAARIVSISDQCKSDIKKRLFDLGIMPGALIKCAFLSPLGDPVAFLIHGTLISLREEDASNINVRQIKEN